MTYSIDETHDPALLSWVESANADVADFPIQNLPYGRFRRAGTSEPWRVGVAIGDQILDLAATELWEGDSLNDLMDLGLPERRALRQQLSRSLRHGSAEQQRWTACLVARSEAELTVPCVIGDYTDFYTSVHHATSVGKQFRPDAPLLPNYKWVPIGYHGRASSIRASGQVFKRPKGQIKPPDSETPRLAPSQRLDYELELGYLVGRGNALGEAISIEEAEKHLFGITLFNDWSARDLQAWEYQPLGPFLSKNFASTISPWVVTLEAMAPFRAASTRPAEDPQPLPYLFSEANAGQGGFDIHLEVLLQTQAMRKAGLPATRLSLGNSSTAAYWTAAQLVTHHTVNGCNLQPGDLLGSGTLSGPSPDEAGSLMELSVGGNKPLMLSNGESRAFLQDGDTLVMRGWCERDGARRISLGEVSGMVVAG